MNAVPSAKQTDVHHIYHKILRSAKFWKLGKHSSALVCIHM